MRATAGITVWPISSVERQVDGPEAFVAAVQSALDEGALKRERRLARERDLLCRSSWDRIVDGMDALVRARLDRRLAERS